MRKLLLTFLGFVNEEIEEEEVISFEWYDDKQTKIRNVFFNDWEDKEETPLEKAEKKLEQEEKKTIEETRRWSYYKQMIDWHDRYIRRRNERAYRLPLKTVWFGYEKLIAEQNEIEFRKDWSKKLA